MIVSMNGNPLSSGTSSNKAANTSFLEESTITVSYKFSGLLTNILMHHMHFRGVTFLVDSMFPRNMEMKLFNLICVTFVVCGAVDGGIGDFDKHTGIQNCCVRNRWEIDYRIRTGRGQCSQSGFGSNDRSDSSDLFGFNPPCQGEWIDS
jgi:hypothetical protein